ncbi:MAG: flagellar hook-associated protein FlgK [Planctomycetaceae bacterium]|nr:MAG: flagellar hook-associated protein FlgK [Planctomycetaceae bacterium]
MTLFLNLSTGVSALRAHQVALDTIAQNIANANTPGYHRQVVDFRSRMPIEIDGHQIGTGVDAVRIGRLRNALLEQSLTANITDRSASAVEYSILTRIESLMTPGPGTIHQRLGDFFDQLERLSAQPDDSTQKTIVLQAAVSLTGELRQLAEGFDNLRRHVSRELTAGVGEANRTLAEITELNARIRSSLARGHRPNDLLDQRDELVNSLAQFIRAESAEQGPHQPVVLLAGGAQVAGELHVELSVRSGSDGTLTVMSDRWDRPLPPDGGRMAAWLRTHNEIIPEFQGLLDDLAVSLMSAVDRVYSSSLDPSGPASQWQGQRSLRSASDPLAQASPVFPVQSGVLFVSITETATGSRSIREIHVDAQTDSLLDVAAALSVVPIRAAVDPLTNTLSISAEPGFAFDFAGRLETGVDRSSIAGSSDVRLLGEFQGDGNDRWHFVVTRGGLVGTADGPLVEVRNAHGETLGTFDFGETYEPGTPLQIRDGISLAVDPGSLVLGDAFAAPLVADPDPGGLLTALGLNTFFAGQSARDIHVNANLVDRPDSLALSRSGVAGETRSLRSLIALREAATTRDGTTTFEESLADQTALAGMRAREAETLHDRLALLEQHLGAQVQGVSGVDINEELVRMLQFQKGFAAAARVISETDKMLTELFRMIG